MLDIFSENSLPLHPLTLKKQSKTMNNWIKIALLVAFHGLMMTDYYYWDKARIALTTFKVYSTHMPAFRQFALSQLDTLGYVLIANVTMIALLVVWICLSKKASRKSS